MKEPRLPKDLLTMPCSRALFCGGGGGMLALASLNSFEIVIIDVTAGKAPSIQGQFSEHRDVVSILAASREWLASADASGAMHLYDLDGLQHHCSIPAFRKSFPTALGFDSSGERLFAASSLHKLMIFDIEA